MWKNGKITNVNYCFANYDRDFEHGWCEMVMEQNEMKRCEPSKCCSIYSNLEKTFVHFETTKILSQNHLITHRSTTLHRTKLSWITTYTQTFDFAIAETNFNLNDQFFFWWHSDTSAYCIIAFENSEFNHAFVLEIYDWNYFFNQARMSFINSDLNVVN